MPDTTLRARAIDAPAIALPAADLSDNARIVLAKRYLKKDESGKPIETPEEMFWRVAATLAAVNGKYGATPAEVERETREFYDLMTKRLFEPNSPTLMNAGRPLGQLSACFVLPVEDELSNGENGIYDTLTNMALVHQSGGGTGFSFSRIRPAGDHVRSTTGVASGPVSFMSLYDASTEVVKQGGTRRGANMGILRVDHPDILSFIDCKQDITKITNFNISVAVTDAFMKAVETGDEYALVNPRTNGPAGRLNAREVFDKVVQNAWRTGEPGIWFVDRNNEFNPVPHLGSYEASNPCGEQSLLPYDVCNLGSVNVGLFARDEGNPVPADDIPADLRASAWAARIDWPEFRRVTHKATVLLDNVIDANQYPLPQITELANRIRRIGLGVMGYADLLVKLGIGYNTVKGVAVGRAVMAFLDEEGKTASEELAEQRGVFPEWERSIWGPDETCARRPDGSRVRPMRRLRNCNITTVAPTGTISIFAGCSSGIEPLFAVAFMRNQAGAMMADVNDEFVRIARVGGWYSEELMTRIAQNGHIHFDEVPADVQRAFVTAHDIAPEWHVRQQAAFQESCDSAISKTTNFPNSATPEQVREIYELAFSLGCKGVTVYRDGSRDNQVLSTGATKSAAQTAEASTDDATAHAALAEALEREAKLQREVSRLNGEVSAVEAKLTVAARTKRRRPDVLNGTTRKMTSPLGDVFVTINEDHAHTPFEVFATLGKAGSVAMADVEAIGRLISLALRSGIPVNEVYAQLRGISSDRAIGFGENKVLSVPDAIAQALGLRERDKAGIQQELIPEMALPVTTGQSALILGFEPGEDLAGACPDCKSQIAHLGGCHECSARCGWTLCG